ncbi:hypothetical protein ONS95_004149 [Cadophora gregata]|uniref:uncharacterized protein n=1 Tax=Cadophora gregata TaxID=51156 RepID=UPI0026DC22CA|nr:uncharacterized protein ONS95_004149 [Cadophora gregata]KAK0105489.1 hypothetical protein ONS96_004874 [Cadophora gregata f. sp. sojae]KAK0105619.1 hypothetical protein ONS95_004149 [Cadophora gregata]
MATSTPTGGTTNRTRTTNSASLVQPPIRPRKNKWLQDDRSHLIGIARRKGDKNPLNWNVEIDPQFARFAPKDWSPDFPPPPVKKKKQRPPSTDSDTSGSGSDGKKKGGGVLRKLMFWKKKKKGKGSGRGRSSSVSGGTGTRTTARGNGGSSSSS